MANLEVYDVTTQDAVLLDMSKELHGRRQIFTDAEEITRENVVDVLTKALGIHNKNRREEIYLKKYVRGIQPILERQKKYYPLMKGLMSLDGNPVPIKAAMAMRGVMTWEIRLPLVPLAESKHEQLANLLKNFNLL